MRTTIDIDEQLLNYVKQKIAENNSLLKNIIKASGLDY